MRGRLEPAHAGCYLFTVASGVSRIIRSQRGKNAIRSPTGKTGVLVASGFGFHAREIRAGSRRLLPFYRGIRREPDHPFPTRENAIRSPAGKTGVFVASGFGVHAREIRAD